MDILESTLIIGLTLILNGLLTIALLKIILVKYNLKPIITMAKQAASMLGQQSQKVQADSRTVKLRKQAKEKVVKGAIEQLPGGSMLQKIVESQGISPDELFSLATDENFVKGIAFILKQFGSLTGAIAGKLSGNKEPEQQTQTFINNGAY